MASRLVPAFMPYLNSSGAVLAGGKLNFYESGTTTPKDTFSDSDLTTANTNPIILGADGKLAVDVWGEGDFKLVVTDASDVVQKTFDPLVGTAFYPQTSSELSGGVTPTNYNYPPGNILRYGAPTDGTSDSEAAMTAAQSSGHDIIIPSGYTFSMATFDLASNKTYWVYGTVKQRDPDRYLWRANGISNVKIFGNGVFQGDATSAVTVANNPMLLWFRGTDGITINGPEVKDGPMDGIYFGADDAGDPCTDITIPYVKVSGCYRNNISVTHASGGRCGTVVCSGAVTNALNGSGPYAGMDFEPNANETIKDFVVDNLITYDNDGNGLFVYGLAADTTNDAQITINNHYSNGDNRGFRIGRWLPRVAGKEVVVQYNGTVKQPELEGCLIDEIGSGVSINARATIYQNDNTLNMIGLNKDETTYSTITGTPTMRLDFTLIGQCAALFNVATLDTASAFTDTEITIDVAALANSSLGMDNDFAGHLVVHPLNNGLVTNDETATTTLTSTDSTGGLRVITNDGATDTVTYTLDNTNFQTGSEVEILVVDEFVVQIVLSDTSKVIKPFGGYQVACGERNARIRLRKLSTGDWERIPSNGGDGGHWTLYGEKTYDIPSLTDGSRDSTTVTVPGAVLGDFVLVTHTRDLSGMTMWGEVTSADTVTVYVDNATGGTLDITSGKVRVKLLKGL